MLIGIRLDDFVKFNNSHFYDEIVNCLRHARNVFIYMKPFEKKTRARP